MQRILFVTGRIFNSIFTSLALNPGPLQRLVTFIINTPYLLFGVSFLIIGFAVGLIKRLIRS